MVDAVPLETGVAFFGKDNKSIASSYKLNEEGELVREFKQKFIGFFSWRLETISHFEKKELKVCLSANNWDTSRTVSFNGRRWETQ